MPRFEVIPAIDIMGGKCVRLLRGEFDKKTVYNSSPLEAAGKWQKLGATRLHVVDLDGARTGTFSNIPVIKEMASRIRVPIQVGGGIRTRDNVDELLGAGVDRVMLGTAVVEDPMLVKDLCAKYGDRIAVSIDSKGGRTAIKGWQVSSDKSPTQLARECLDLGVVRFIYTDISRDGTLSGPNIKGLRDFAEAAGAPVIASGGVSSYDDLEALKGLASVGIEGCVIGKALYSGAIDLKKALEYNSI